MSDTERLLFFPSPVDLQRSLTVTAPDVVKIHTPLPDVTEQVTVRALAPAKTSHLAISDDQWSWQDLRDYVVGQIESVIGLFPRDEKKEYGIFSAFASRWGADAPKIARYAFEHMGGYWKGAPVKVTRFCKASDEYFAVPIAEKLKRV